MSIQGLSDRLLLIVLDGFGLREDSLGNAIRTARTPRLDHLFDNYPFTTLEAGGVQVGLPKGIAGNSEVGHMNLGSGRAIRQDLVRINGVIEEGNFSELPALKKLVGDVGKRSRRLHLMTLLSDGGVHSHINHLVATLGALVHTDIDIYLHAFLDGRDTPPRSGKTYLRECLSWQAQYPRFHLASLQGRSFGMDRDRRWEKIESAYQTFTGAGNTTDEGPLEYLKSEYQNGRSDEFARPVLFDKEASMGGEDAVFFLNFRPDRAVQITLALTDPAFSHFPRPWRAPTFLCMTPYIEEQVKLPILFDKEPLEGGLSEYLSKRGMKQFKIAETEKYAHVTYFFNGGRRKAFPGEEQVLIPSPRDVASYADAPEMSAFQVTERLTQVLSGRQHQFTLVNYANSDMVGHTGDYPAAIRAVETIDACVGQLLDKAQDLNLAVLLCSDHGNSDQMLYPDGTPHTSHTGAPVPCALFHPSLAGKKLTPRINPGTLCDVAPTILKILGLPLAPTFEGRPLF